MKRIQPDNIEYILIKEPCKKSGYVLQWYTQLAADIESGSMKRVLKTLQELAKEYHESCMMLKRIPEPQYQMVIMMACGTSQYKKHSMKFLAKYLGWDKEDVIKMVVLLLNTMEPDLIDSHDYQGVMLSEADTAKLNRAALMRYSLIDQMTDDSNLFMSQQF